MTKDLSKMKIYESREENVKKVLKVLNAFKSEKMLSLISIESMKKFLLITIGEPMRQVINHNRRQHNKQNYKKSKTQKISRIFSKEKVLSYTILAAQ